jgi:hypothetical protein
MTTDAAMIGRADFMPSAKGITRCVMIEKRRLAPMSEPPNVFG